MTGEPALCFIDIETSGLDPEFDVILEIGAMTVDKDLNVIAIFQQVVQWDKIEYDAMRNIYTPPFGVHKDVVVMHEKNGLWEESYRCKDDLWMGITNFDEWLFNHIPAPAEGQEKIPIAGNSVWFDRDFLSRAGVPLGKWFHYRQVDVSSIKTLHRLWLPGTENDKPDYKSETHRAVADCHESIQELKWYRQQIFAPLGGGA